MVRIDTIVLFLILEIMLSAFRVLLAVGLSYIWPLLSEAFFVASVEMILFLLLIC